MKSSDESGSPPNVIRWAIIGCIVWIISGLTLIYSASGIYNLAFGAFAFMGALAYYELSGYMPRGLAFVVTVLVL